MASRELKDLHPKVQLIAATHVLECKKAGIDLLIYCAYRSNEEQAFEFGRGRTFFGIPCKCNGKENAKGKCKTHPLGLKSTGCKAGQSPHNNTEKGIPASKAYDCVPLVNGKAAWSNEALYKKVAAIGKKLGLIWGGDFRSKDSPHFELSCKV